MTVPLESLIGERSSTIRRRIDRPVSHAPYRSGPTARRASVGGFSHTKLEEFMVA